MSSGQDLAANAEAAARQVAGRAGVEVRPLTELPELRAVCELYQRVWGPPLVTIELLRALTHAGNYLAGAYARGELVGAALGFFGTPSGRSLHSHITAVAPTGHGRGVGLALKLHQRAWALARDLSVVTWTFDPLIRRNAYFNLVKLAARPREYLVDFYGELDDTVNAGQGSDRLLVAWELAAERVVEACAGRPAEARPTGAVPALSISDDGGPRPGPGRTGTVLVAVPPDIEWLRRQAPEAARAWRLAVRDVLGGLLAAGGRVTGFSRAGGYVVETS